MAEEREIDTITVNQLPSLALKLENLFAHSDSLGNLYKGSFADLAAFLAPYITAIGGSGFVATTGTVLPAASAGKYTFVGAGTFTQATGGSITTTALLNLLASSATTWSLAVAVPVAIPDIKVSLWTARAYVSDFEVLYNGKYWRSNAATLATDIPGTSTKWVEELSAYASRLSPKKNLPFTLTDGQGLVAAGTLNPDVNYETAYMVPIPGTGARITVTTADIFDYAITLKAYDIKKAPLTAAFPSGDLVNYQFIQPEGCAFISVCNYKPDGVTMRIEIEENPYETAIATTKEIENKIKNEVVPNAIVSEGRYIMIDGSISVPNAGNYEYSFYDVLPFETLLISLRVSGAVAPVAFYDKYGVFRSYIPTKVLYNNEPVTVPEGCYKMGLSNTFTLGVPLLVLRQPISFAVSTSRIELNEKQRDIAKTETDSFYRIASGITSYNIENEPIGLIVAGQSNMDGRAPFASYPTTWTDGGSTYNYLKSIPNLKWNYNNVNGVLTPYNLISGNWGPDSIVYNKINQYLGGATDFYAIKRSLGGTSIKFNAIVPSWWPIIQEFHKYPGLVSLLYQLEVAIKNALLLNPQIKFKAILWHQGESDMDAKNTLYYRDFSRVIAYIRGIAKNPNLPFIFGTVSSASLSYSSQIKADMQAVANNVPYTYLIDMNGQPLLPDNLHFDAVGTEYLGTKMFEILRDNYLLRRKV